jgi:hypothetical protein
MYIQSSPYIATHISFHWHASKHRERVLSTLFFHCKAVLPYISPDWSTPSLTFLIAHSLRHAELADLVMQPLHGDVLVIFTRTDCRREGTKITEFLFRQRHHPLW